MYLCKNIFSKRLTKYKITALYNNYSQLVNDSVAHIEKLRLYKYAIWKRHKTHMCSLHGLHVRIGE